MTRGWTDPRALLLAVLWIPSVLWLDRSADLLGQLALGALTWGLLLWWLKHETPLVRMQTAIVIVIAAACLNRIAVIVHQVLAKELIHKKQKKK